LTLAYREAPTQSPIHSPTPAGWGRESERGKKEKELVGHYKDNLISEEKK